MVCCWSQASQGQGTDQLTLFWPQHSSLPRQGLMKAFNKEEYEHQRASLPFQVPCLWSSCHLPRCPVLCLPLSELLPPACQGALMPQQDWGRAALCQARCRVALPLCPLQLVVLLGCAIPTQSLSLPGRAATDTGRHGARTCLGPEG